MSQLELPDYKGGTNYKICIIIFAEFQMKQKYIFDGIW